MYPILRRFLFAIPPERVHHQVMRLLKRAYALPPLRHLMKKMFSYTHASLERKLWGLNFPNPVGLAAGFDKDARFVDALSCLGFGFVEIGTLTPRPQPGNIRPRLFRLPDDQALINRMGFNNDGTAAARKRLSDRKEKLIIGGNIGKNKSTPNDQAFQDYEAAFRDLFDYVDYFVVNVSSPNTPNLRSLQEKEPLTELLQGLMRINQETKNPKPLLLKIAPDLHNNQLNDIIEIVQTTGIHGVVATNTTISREGLKTDPEELRRIGAGGLSGLPLKDRATEIIRYIHQKSKGKIPIIAVGGIFTARDAREKLKAGATLVQVYTGFIYEGPAIAKKICEELIRSKMGSEH